MARILPGIRNCATSVALLLIAVSTGAATQEAIAAAPSAAPARVTQLGAVRGGGTDWIEAEARRLAGRELTVTCAATMPEWAADVADAGLAGVADGYYGLSLIAAGEMRLSPYVCEGLRLGLTTSTRRVNDLQVAWAVDVLLHESVHMARSTPDEALAEACARQALPGELHRLYGIRYDATEMKSLTLAATWFRRTQPGDYQGGTCA